MKRQYGPIQGLLLSLFSPAYYRDVARNWGGIGLVYLLLLLALTWIPVLVKWQRAVGAFATNQFAEAMKDFPPISIKDGKASSPVDQPYEFKDDNGRLLFVFDSTGKIKTIADTTAPILVTETKFYSRDDRGNVQVHSLSDFPNIDITKEFLQDWLSSAANWLGVVLFPFVMALSLMRALILMLIAAVLGLIFRGFMNPHATFGTLMRMAAMGLTLSVYIDTALMVAGVAVPFWFLIAIILTTSYVLFGLNASAEPESLPPSDDFRDAYRA